jgi:uncharacterized protein YukE
MSETIRYDYGNNHDHLDAIQSSLNAAQELREDVDKVFKALNGIYEGDAADALQTQHQQLSTKLDDVIAQLHLVQASGVTAQHEAADLDRSLAGNL